MKRLFFVLSVVAFLIFGCSTSNSEPELSRDSPIKKSFNQSLDFTNVVSTVSKMANSKNSNSNGVMFFEKSGAFSNFIGFFDFPNLILVYELNEEGNPDPLIDVKVFDENKAQFSANTNNPYVEISNLFTGEILFSNICDDEKIGHFHVNWTAPYSVIDFGFGPLYFPENPEESMTVNNLQLSVQVNNGFVLTNPETGEGDCNSPSAVTNLKIINVAKNNNESQNNNSVFKIIGL
ncbi:hypothetical protein [Aestuariivivens sediminis]|uniref:hypothetical protein n=1 Tax=Aestuariivivens sediminis TaxID=2913557 RepID=UPI001F56251A|nr:hypothetical protein [Aestuariivivens sediminis]